MLPDASKVAELANAPLDVAKGLHAGTLARDVTKAKWDNPLSQHHVQVELPRLHIQVERECGRHTARSYVHDGEICRIGSAGANDLVLDDPTISRFHCSIQREAGAWRIVDTGCRGH